jgi:NAD(P)-dependent dehydrogenase (short-subunit alcohol dehydrogenase family)
MCSKLNNLLLSANDADVAKAIDHVLAIYGHIDALILNAAILEPLGRIGDDDTPISAWKSHFDINFFSLVSVIKASLPSLRASDLGGRVIFVSSGAAVTGKYVNRLENDSAIDSKPDQGKVLIMQAKRL